MRFSSDKLETNFIEPINLYGPIKDRKYTLTHSDTTGMMFLTIANEYDYNAINYDLRDEILGAWKESDTSYILFFYAYVGNLSYADALYRYNIFKSHIDSALQAIIYGDRMLLSKYPELLNTPIYIKFDSSIPVLIITSFMICNGLYSIKYVYLSYFKIMLIGYTYFYINYSQ